MSEIEVRGLVKRLDKKSVLDRVSFRVGNEEFLVVLGPSGSGKTSLLRLISGFDYPDEGRILLNGQDITRQEPFMRNLATVFQDHGLFPHMDVSENIAYSLQLRRLARQEIAARISNVAAILQLQPLLKRRVSTLSVAEQQQASIACALVQDADVYLFDEPLPQLDAQMRYRIRQEIMMVHRLKRRPGLYVTRDQHEALTMADRIVILDRGRVQQIGTPDELLQAPANLWVARLLGRTPINIIEGYVQHADTRYQLHSASMNFTFPARWTHSLAHLGEQSAILLGIRPDIIIPEWDFATLGCIPHVILRSRITHLELAGGKVQMRLRINANCEITAEFEGGQVNNLRIGQTFSVAINPDRVYYFHPATEELLNHIS